MEAIAWFTRMQGNSSRDDQSDFRAWLDMDSAHRQIYDEIASLWSSARISGLQIAREDAAILEQRLRTRRQRRRLNTSGSIITSCLVGFLAVSWIWLEKPNFWQDLNANYVSARGETRQILLDDGSSVLLDADTAINVRLDDDARQVELLRGTAFFEVKPSSVPFIVKAANGRSHVLGTAFDVALNDEGVEVTLEHGSLRVEVVNSMDQVVLKPGESIGYSDKGLSALKNIELSDTLAWHEGRFVFNNMTVMDVLQKIERYRNGRIIVLGSNLSERRISGSFSLKDSNAALSSLQASVGFNMHKLSERLIIIGP